MQVGSGTYTYEWQDNWARIPQTPSGQENGRTHGIAVSQDGTVYVFNQANPAVLAFDPSGKLLASWGDRFPGAHGLTLVQENGSEYLWLTDQGTGEVVKTTLDGKAVQSIERAPHPAYEGGKYSPTWVAVNPGNGDIWVADGYGSSLVHRYDSAGNYIATLSGEEGQAGRFKCPHGIWFDTRKSEPELYIADRGNQRVQVYDGDGQFKRAFGSDFLNSPCGFITHGENLVVPELRARVVICDGDDKPVAVLGGNEPVCDVKGWPDHNKTGNPQLIEAGKFNSPHGIAADAQGNIYVAEWIIGGRITKLARV